MSAMACRLGCSRERSFASVTRPLHPFKTTCQSKVAQLSKEKRTWDAGRNLRIRPSPGHFLSRSAPTRDGVCCSVVQNYAVQSLRAKDQPDDEPSPRKDNTWRENIETSTEWDVPEDMYKGTEVVVAGADTYLGFKIVERLVAKGLPVRALVRPNVTNQVLNDLMRLRGVKILYADYIIPRLLKAKFGDSNVLIIAIGTRPTANADAIKLSRFQVKIFNPSEIDPAIVEETKNLVEEAKSSSIKRIVLLSALTVDEPLRAFYKTYIMGEQYVTESKIKHTIIRPGVLCDEPPDLDTFLGRAGDLRLDFFYPGTLRLGKGNPIGFSRIKMSQPKYEWTLTEQVADVAVKAAVSPDAAYLTREVVNRRSINWWKYLLVMPILTAATDFLVDLTIRAIKAYSEAVGKRYRDR